MAYTILIAEDDNDIATILKLYLENVHYQVFTAQDGKTAYQIFKNHKIDLAIIDIMLPEMNGHDLTKAIRKDSYIPILILSAQKEELCKVLSLNIGADDFVTKPFNSLEILARVDAHLRRYYDFNQQHTEHPSLTVGDLVLNSDTFKIEKAGRPILLTATEFKLLQSLMEAPGKIFTKSQLYKKMNDKESDGDENAVMLHISHIRDKIEDNAKEPTYIKTVRGIGYKIENI